MKWLFAFSLWLWASPSPLPAEVHDVWRFWTLADGLQETYSYSVGSGARDWATVRHGAIRYMSVLDGYRVLQIPDPRIPGRVDTATRGRATGADDGAIWMTLDRELLDYRNGGWNVRYRAAPGERLIAAVPSADRVIVLLAGALRALHPASGTWSTLRDAANTRIGEFSALVVRGDNCLVAGSRGLGLLHLDAAGATWRDVPGRAYGLSDFRYPLAGAEGEVFAQARTSRGSTAVVRWSANRLEPVYTTATGTPRGWRGPDGMVWILEGPSLFRLTPRGARGGAARWGAGGHHQRCVLRR